MARITFYTRVGCHLCDLALTSLDPFRARGEISLEVVDLDREARPEKLAAYTNEVPVVELEGRKIMKYRVDTERLRRLLDIR
jgi:glutaredoxin